MNVVVRPIEITVSAAIPNMDVTSGTPVVTEYVERPAYTGAYEVTPSSEMQTLETKHKRMTDNITINPIPSNYGLITWNGSYLTVS